MRRLEQLKLIRIQRQGMGKPHKIYPLEAECSTEKTAVLNAENRQSGVRKISSHGCDFSAGNKTYNNKTYFIQSDSIGDGYGESAGKKPYAYKNFGKNTVLERIKKAEQEERQKQFDFGKSSILERAKKLSQEQDNRG